MKELIPGENRNSYNIIRQYRLQKSVQKSASIQLQTSSLKLAAQPAISCTCTSYLAPRKRWRSSARASPAARARRSGSCQGTPCTSCALESSYRRPSLIPDFEQAVLGWIEADRSDQRSAGQRLTRSACVLLHLLASSTSIFKFELCSHFSTYSSKLF